MKRKLFCLLTLLLTVCSGAWAADYVEICSANLSGVTDKNRASGSSDGNKCTIGWSNINKLSDGQSVSGTTYLKISGGYVTLALSSGTFQAGDIITASVSANSNNKTVGINLHTKEGNGKTTTVTTQGNAYDVTYTLVAADIEEDGSLKIFGPQTNGRYYSFSVKREDISSAPTITTDLSSTANVTVGVPQEFSIVATGASSYQWYLKGEAIDGATSSSYSYTAEAAGNEEIYCNAINAIGTTKSTVCTVTAAMPASAPTITTNLETAYNVIKSQTLELSIVATGASSYQWYLDGEAIGGATTDTYTFTAGSTIGATNTIYCAATNAAGTTNSTTATITTTGRSDCELTNIKFSNGAYGAINNSAYDENTIAVPYMSGESAPTVNESSIDISDGATYALDGNTLTVTAEDGTTNKAFTITTVPMTPLEVATDVETTSFSNVPSWIFNLYGYSWGDKDSDRKGLKFAKAVNENNNMRIALGNTRQYYFIGAAKKLTLKGSPCATRKVNVYKNGTKVSSNVDNTTIEVDLDEDNPCMVMIESNQTSGDGGFKSYAILAATQKTITPANAMSTYVTPAALDFSEVDGLTAYVATGKGTGTVVMSPVTAVPADTPLLLVGTAGTPYSVPVAAEASAPGTNYLKKGPQDFTGTEEDKYILWTDGKFHLVDEGTLAANKAYLDLAGTGARELSIAFEDDGETTAISEVRGLKSEVRGEYFNLNGQRVAQPTKGLYIVNGRKVVIK